MRQALPDADAADRRQQRCYAPAPRHRGSGGCSRPRAYEHFEEPCPYWELEQTKEVTDALTHRRDRRRAGLSSCRSGAG